MAIAFANQKGPVQRQQYGKGKAPTKHPAKKPGAVGDASKPRKALLGKKKK